jgi:hypothetical protein
MVAEESRFCNIVTPGKHCPRYFDVLLTSAARSNSCSEIRRPYTEKEREFHCSGRTPRSHRPVYPDTLLASTLPLLLLFEIGWTLDPRRGKENFAVP